MYFRCLTSKIVKGKLSPCIVDDEVFCIYIHRNDRDTFFVIGIDGRGGKNLGDVFTSFAFRKSILIDSNQCKHSNTPFVSGCSSFPFLRIYYNIFENEIQVLFLDV